MAINTLLYMLAATRRQVPSDFTSLKFDDVGYICVNTEAVKFPRRKPTNYRRLYKAQYIHSLVTSHSLYFQALVHVLMGKGVIINSQNLNVTTFLRTTDRSIGQLAEL